MAEARVQAPEGARRIDGVSRATAAWLVAFLVLAGLGLRGWYASAEPDKGRFWDERYSLMNIRSFLVEGTLRPAKVYYPSPVFNLPPALAIRALSAGVEEPEARLFDPATGDFGPWAYWICRGTQVVYGAASILVLYLLGSALFGRAAGLVAAAAIAFMPWQVNLSGYFKPDAQLGFWILVAWLAAVCWHRRPSHGWAAAFGAALALAVSSKVLAAFVGVAFGLSVLARVPSRRQLLHVVTAAVTSVSVFFLTNPYWGYTLAGIEAIGRDYAKRAGWRGMEKSEVPARVLELLVAPTVFGVVIGSVAVVAFVLLAVRGVRLWRRGDRELAAPLLMLAVFPPLYTLVYALRTPYFKPNNFMPVVPVFAVALGWAAARVGSRWLDRVPGGARRWVAAAGTVALAATLLVPGWLYVYRSFTPTTLDVARHFIGRQMRDSGGRVVLLEPVVAAGIVWDDEWTLQQRGLAVVRVDGPHGASPERRRLVDAEVLEGDRASEVGRAEVSEADVMVVRPSPFRLRGPTLTAVRHRWRRRETRELDLRTCGNDLCADVSGVGKRRHVSVSIYGAVAGSDAPQVGGTVAYADREVDFHWLALHDRGFSWVSERFPSAGGRREVRLRGLAGVPLEAVHASLSVWMPPAQPGDEAGS